MKHIFLLAIVVSVSLELDLVRNKRRRLKTRKNKLDLEHIEIKRPIQDKREFYRIKLENELEVVMIESPEIEYSQAVVAVNVGSYNNPPNIPGLAHYLEHLGKFGKKSLNDPKIYPQCVSKYQGSRNAMTSGKETYYYFSVSKAGLTECLNLLLGFFIDPNFDQEASVKEIDAVESEYQNNMGTRMEGYAFTKLIKSKYPQNKFSVGNKKSLLYDVEQSNLDIVDELYSFFNKYYSSNLIKIVIESPSKPEQYFESIRNNLLQIKNRNIDKQVLFSQQQLFRPKQYLIKYISNLETPRLSIFFEISSLIKQYRRKSLDYIINLFNSPHPNSLQDNLIKKQLIIKFEASNYIQLTNIAIIKFQFDLTGKGYQQIYDIVDIFYGYVEYLKLEGIQQWIYEQMSKYYQTSFDYSQKNTDLIGLVANSFYYDIDDILQQDYQYQDYQPQEIRYYLELINRSKAQYSLGSNKFILRSNRVKTGNYQQLKSQSIYHHNILMNLKYQLIDSPFKQQYNDDISSHFQLPRKNPYIPELVQPIESNPIYDQDQDRFCKHDNKCDKIIKESPELLSNSSIRIWYLKVDKFIMPQQQIGFQFIIPASDISLRTHTLNSFLVQHLKSIQKYQFYELPQEIYSISVKQSIQSIKVVFVGDSDKLQTVIKEYFEQVVRVIDKEQFEMLKYQLIDDLVKRNKNKLGAYYTAMNGLKYNMFTIYFKDRQILKQIPTISHLQFLNHVNRFFVGSSLETFCAGWICQSECQEIVEQVRSIQKEQMNSNDEINTIFNQISKIQVRDIQNYELEIILRNQNSYDNNHVILQYRQFGVWDLKMKVITEIISSQLYVRAFQYLRTNKQLGYKIAAAPLKLGNVYGYIVGIQGTVYDVQVYCQEIYQFWNIFDKYIEGMDSEEFEYMKKSYLSNNKQPFQDLSQLFQYFWEQIEEQSYEFELKNKVEQVASELDLESVKQFYKAQFFKNEFLVKLKTQSEYTEEDKMLQQQYQNVIQGFNLLK